jgi:phospholipase C
MMWMTGTVDPNGKNGGPIISNVEVTGGYTLTTYAERLAAAGVSWKVYLEPESSGHHMLQHFARQRLPSTRDRSAFSPGRQVRGAGQSALRSAVHHRKPGQSAL